MVSFALKLAGRDAVSSVCTNSKVETGGAKPYQRAGKADCLQENILTKLNLPCVAPAGDMELLGR